MDFNDVVSYVVLYPSLLLCVVLRTYLVLLVSRVILKFSLIGLRSKYILTVQMYMYPEPGVYLHVSRTRRVLTCILNQACTYMYPEPSVYLHVS